MTKKSHPILFMDSMGWAKVIAPIVVEKFKMSNGDSNSDKQMKKMTNHSD